MRKFWRPFTSMGSFLLLCFLLPRLALSQVDSLDSLQTVLKQLSKQDTNYVLTLIELCESSTFTAEQGGKAYAEEAIKVSKDLGFKRGEALGHNSLGAYFLQVGNLERALKEVLQAEGIYRKIGEREGILAVYNNLGIIYNRTEELDKAIKVYEDAISVAKELELDLQQAILFNNLGTVHDKRGEYELALEAFEEVLSVSERAAIEVGKMMGYSNLGSVYHTMGQFEEAESAYFKALEISEGGAYTRNQASNYFGIAEVRSGQSRMNESREWYQKGIALAEEINSLPLLQEGYEGLAALNEKVGSYAQALEHYKLAQAFRDSLAMAERAETIEELKTRYETSQKEAEIEVLSQQNEIQNLELRQKNQLLWSGGIGIGLLILIAYGYQQRKQIKNQVVLAELEQRFLRSQLNPHFIFNALSSIQNFMLKSDSKKAAIYLSKFSKLMRQVLENSRTEFISLEEEVRMLENYLEIQQVLSNQKFSFEIKLSDDLEPQSFSIPPMFVQPFVENAIEHGLVREQGSVQVHFKKGLDYITITILDDGVGINNTSTQSAPGHQSLATSIIRERIDNFNLKLNHKIQIEMQDRSVIDPQQSGTQVQLRVPYQEN
ncbi:tetratricopeptide repeat-containing sensor histidine kinase [Algoriphagus faecimaris]|nr:tetratricopeptide repeat protein [Algoriphagus faecimaris]